jgi:raffinose synthase
LVLEGVEPALAAELARGGMGVFLRATATHDGARHRFRLGAIAGLKRFTCTYRYDPFWMRPAAGTRHAEVPAETQYVLAERQDGLCVLIVPLFEEPFRFALSGDEDGLELVGETGDAFRVGRGGLAAFVATGRDPYRLVAASARAVTRRLRIGRLRREKRLPDFVNQFGWCTWDAFYQQVSHDKVCEGLRGFAAGGVAPALLILDDGWLDVAHSPVSGQRLVSLRANERFNGTLAPTVHAAKAEFHVRTFLVWHAVGGYWAGIDPTRLPAYGAREIVRAYGPGILRHTPDANHMFGPVASHIPPSGIAAFYDDFHRGLAAWGVDGVKVDNQASIEGLATGVGGRVGQYRAYREALERSARTHFQGQLINCMSNANETHLMCRDSTLLRTSTDFWPTIPSSHGAHLYTNAQVGVWFGQFIHPDWDMFQSGHERSAFHAAGRAVSGGPVYVSDKPGAHDFALLRKLVLHDGTVLRADRPGVPTRDCLFRDPTREPVLLKVLTYNGAAALIGLFHCQYHADAAQRRALSAKVSAADAPELGGQDVALFCQRSGRLRHLMAGAVVRLRLGEGEWELCALVPIRRGLAAVGLADKLNSAGAVVARRDQAGVSRLTLRDGGDFVAWCARRPRCVTVRGREVAFRFQARTGRLDVHLERPGRQSLVIHR